MDAKTPFLDVADILSRSADTKGGDYDADAIKLGQLYDDQARALIAADLKKRGLGRPNEDMPVHIGMLRRIVDSLSVVYRTPAVRRLAVGGRELADANADARALADVYGRCQIDTHWQVIDSLRNLYRTVAVAFAESGPHRSVQVRAFEPYNVHRVVNPLAADVLDEDERFLLQIAADATDDRGNLYQAWLHEDDGSWRMHVVDGRGELAEGITQPYGETGRLPWGATLPVMLVYDELPRGRAFLPIPQSRVSFALAINRVIADLQYLVEMEAHTMLHLATSRKGGGVPTEIGPGKIAVTPEDAKLTAISLNPKIKECGEVIDQLVRFWLTSECIPPDDFRAEPQVQTGAALRVRNRDLEARRQRQTPLAQIDERIAYEKIRSVHNHYAGEWGLPPLSERADLRLQIGRAWQPSDPAELQARYNLDISIGAASVLDYLQERDGITRDAAISLWERIQEDRKLYPTGTAEMPNGAPPTQNPAANLDGNGPNAAGVSQAKVPGAMNADRASSVEGASVVAAVRAA